MNIDQKEFVDAIMNFLNETIKGSDIALEYSYVAVKVIDARNHLFQIVEQSTTDEAANVYALRDLCRMEEGTLEMIVDEGRLKSIARNYFY